MLWCITAWACTVIWDVALRISADRADFLTIAFLVVRDAIFVSLVLAEVRKEGKLVNLELLVFRGMGIIESPLLQWDISADKVNQVAVLLIKGLKDRE